MNNLNLQIEHYLRELNLKGMLSVYGEISQSATNYNFDEWGAVFENRIVATAIIDRLVHHARIFYVNGHSYRLKNKLKKGNQ